MCYNLHSYQISAQLNTYRRLWSDVFDSALHHHGNVR